MNKNLTLGIGIGTAVLALIGLVLGYFAMTDTLPDPVTNEPLANPNSVDNALKFTFVAIAIGLGAWILFALWGIVQNPKKFITTGIGLVVFGIIGGIGYGMASSSNAETTSWIEKAPEVTDGSVMWANAGMMTTYIVLIIAIIAIIGGLILGLLRYFSK